MSKFEQAYTEWFNRHVSEARGERRRRLLKKFGFGEKLLLLQAWWPAVGNFDYLIPEFEFVDIFGNHYFIDLAYVRKPDPTALESDSFGSHARDVDRDQFSHNLDRQNEIVLSNWNILRLATDKLKDNPVACQNVIRRMLVIWYGEESPIMDKLNIYQRELVRRVTRSAEPLSIQEACTILGKKEKFTRTQLHSLLELDLLESAILGERERVHYFKLKNSDHPTGAANRVAM
jgi:hypothetical protein